MGSQPLILAPPALPASTMWWVLSDGQATGPFEEADVHTALRPGALSGETLACPVATQTWKPLAQWPMFAAGALSAQAPGTLPPWSPIAIGCLGLLFGPLWLGVMAAINGTRLQRHNSIWKAPIIAAVGFVLYYLVNLRVAHPYALDLLIYLLTLAVIWVVELHGQQVVFKNRAPNASARPPRWLWPALAGSPLGLAVILVLVLPPFLPPTPREVCQRLIDAKNLEEIKAVTTTKLWPAMTAIEAAFPSDLSNNMYELTGESEGQGVLAGQLVGWRTLDTKSTPAHVIEGFFHVVKYDSNWKVEDMYVTTYDNQALTSYFSVASGYSQLLASATPPPPETVAATPTDSLASASPVPPAPPSTSAARSALPYVSSRAASALPRLATAALETTETSAAKREAPMLAEEAGRAVSQSPLGSAVWKAIAAAVVAVIGVIAKIVAVLTGRKQPETKPT